MVRSDSDDGAREVLDSDDVQRALTRIAHEILERNKGAQAVILLGIPTRGVPLASRLAERIGEVEGRPVPHGSLDITMFRDDLRMRPARGLGRTELPDGGIDDAVVVLVDDVLFSGRSIRGPPSTPSVSWAGRMPCSWLSSSIVGIGSSPIRADYVGKNLPTSTRESVQVLVAEHDGRDAVLIGGSDDTHNDTGSSDDWQTS